MNTPNEAGKPADNTESPKQQTAGCGPGCGCNATGTPGKTRWVIGAFVLIAAGALVVRAMLKSDGAATRTTAPTFAALAAPPTPAGEGVTATNSAATSPAVETSVGTSIGALGELNTVAAKTDAVFVFLPGRDGTSGNAPSTSMQGAVRMVESKAGIKCGLFTLKPGSPDYDQIAKQMSVPGVVAMVKGCGMSAISGEITEAKLVQGFVAASSASASGCGPSAKAGCCPKK
jgi:MYXO-CTERM domain-containing protein